MSTARHIDSTNPERVRVMMATGHIKDGQTTLRVARRADRHRRLPAHLRDTVAWWTRINYRLLRDEGVSRTLARSIVRTYAHLAYMGVAHENGRAEKEIPGTGLTPEGSRKVAECNGHV